MAIAFRSILSPIQFDDPSYHALHYAARIAADSGGTVHLLHVVEKYPALGEAEISENDNILEEDTARERLSEIAGEQLGTAKYQVHVAAAAPRALAKAIVQVAGEVNADLIVLRTHGRKGLGHRILGGVAEEVVRVAACPVLTLTAAAQEKLT
jgi:nucleotide-binding universal stress UspA family protein